MSRNFDAIDLRILNELQENGRQSIVELAGRIHLTKTPCSERVKRLERDGVIKGYRAVIDPTRVDKSHVTVVHINLSKTESNVFENFARAVAEIPEVESCLMIAGSFDYMLKVRTRDIAEFRELLGERITNLPGVLQTHSFAVMETITDRQQIPL